MEIDCEHHQILLELIQRIPQLNDDLQSFLQSVKFENFLKEKDSFFFQEKWSRDRRHGLVNLLVQHLLQNDSFSSTFSEELQRVFPNYFIAFIHRLFTAVNVSTKITQQISIKQRFLVLLAQLLHHYPSLHA